MALRYELWDFDTRNIVAVFESQDAALQSVWDTLGAQGRESAGTLVLLSSDDAGDGEHIAANGALIARAEAFANRTREQVAPRR